MDRPIYLRLREARRTQGMSQAALAQAVNCRQSAVSMMENGQVDALARDRLLAIADLLGVEGADREPAAPPDVATVGRDTLKICPTAECPSNTPYLVAGTLHLLPVGVVAPPLTATYCAFCGEVLESSCPNCRAPVRAGACCTACGSDYVPAPPTPAAEVPAWVERQRELALQIRHLMSTIPTAS